MNGEDLHIKFVPQLIKRCFSLLVFCCLVSSNLEARPTSSHLKNDYEAPYFPWFVTGPLLAPTPVNMEVGHPAIEPIIVVSGEYGSYDDKWSYKNKETVWSVSPSVDFQFAFTENTGFEIYAAYTSNFKSGKTSSHFLDTNVFLGYQISKSKANSWVPNFRADLHLLLPSGNYQKLDSRLEGIDSTGQGSYQLGPTLIAEKLFPIGSNFLSLVWSAGYLWGVPTEVKGRNAYGGAKNTQGKSKPGDTLLLFFSGEYSLCQHWIIANDFSFVYQKKSSFSGIKGVNDDGSIPDVSVGPYAQISITPSIEYDVSENLGILVGSWLSLGGRNASAFASVFASMVYIF